MPTTLIFGGSGKVARCLTRILTSRTSPAHTVYSIIRNGDQSQSLEALGAKPIVQSIEEATVSDLQVIITRLKPDVVVWSAGAGGGSAQRTVAVDRDGAIKVMDALAATGKNKRFIIVSAIDVRDRKNRPVPDWYKDSDKAKSDQAWSALGAYLEAKLAADKELRTGNDKRQLAYTIVRPSTLTEEPASGRVAAGKVGSGRKISREDVGLVVAACIENSGTIGLAFDVIGDGEDGQSVKEAVAKVVDKKIDTFEGYY
jgi:nucleoside-diphosphate-sugar epimerase